MAIEVDRQAEYPRIMFGDGNLATVYREEYLPNGKVCLICFPEEVAILRARLENQLEENWEPSILAAIEGGKSYPCIVPKASVIKLSDDPNGPRWFCTYSMTGSKEIFNQENLAKFVEICDENARLRKQLSDSNKFIEKLRERNDQLVLELTKKYNVDKKLMPPNFMSVDDAMRMRERMDNAGR